jgi:hypothetical protein
MDVLKKNEVKEKDFGVVERKSKTYSHSRLWLYENCPEAYKIKYIDKTFPELPSSIHAFLGSMAHNSLEWLYNEVQRGRIPELDELIEYYLESWNTNYSKDIRINNGGKESFLNKGIKFLIDYYQKHKPFSEETLETEKQITFPLDEEGKYKILGYIDRIVFNNGTYEVHDYKTNSKMKAQSEVDKDRQLAFYHLGMLSLFGNDIDVELVWHFLAFNQSIKSKRTQEQLDSLKFETLELIKKIENTNNWWACGKQFCDWCSYKKNNMLNGPEDAMKLKISNINSEKGNYSLDNYS